MVGAVGADVARRDRASGTTTIRDYPLTTRTVVGSLELDVEVADEPAPNLSRSTSRRREAETQSGSQLSQRNALNSTCRSSPASTGRIAPR
jgi:hypothetical protein